MNAIDHISPRTMPMRPFERVYYAVAVLTLAAVTCLPWLVPLSYRVLAFEPWLARSGSHAAFQAHVATLSLRRGFLAGVLLLAVSLMALSLVALPRRALRRTNVPWPVLALTLAGAAGVAVVLIAGLAAGAVM